MFGTCLGSPFLPKAATFVMASARLLGVFVGFCLVSATYAATSVNQVLDGAGNASLRPVVLSEATHWDLDGSPYLIEQRFVIGDSASLSIDSGVIVRVVSGQAIEVLGTLNAEEVTFEGVDAAPWRGIYFGPGSSASLLADSVIRQTSEDLGVFNGAWRRTAVYLDRGGPTLRDNQISVPDGHGIEAFASEALIEGNEIEVMNPDHFAIWADTLNLLPKFSNNVALGQGRLGVGLAGGGITHDGRWTKVGAEMPYLVEGGLVLGAGVELVIEAGVTIQMPMFRWQVAGKLLVEGTEMDPVRVMGPWLGFVFSAGSGESQLRFCEIHDAGAADLGVLDGAWRRSAIYMSGASPILDQVVIEGSGGSGIELFNSSPRLQMTTIHNAVRNGLVARGGSNPLLISVNFVENGSDGFYTVLTDASSVPNPSAVNFFRNALQGIQVDGGSINRDISWENWGDESPFVVTKDLTVLPGMTWTVESGVTVKLSKARAVVSGVLSGIGTSESPVVFTSLLDDTFGGDTNGDGEVGLPAQGDWNGIYFGPQSGDSRLSHCELRYAGGESIGNINGSWRQTAIYIDKSHPEIADSKIIESAGNGIEVFSSDALIERVEIREIQAERYAILFHGLNSYPRMADNLATGEGFLGVFLPPGAVFRSGSWTNPGDTLPYYLSGDLSIPASHTLTLEAGTKFELSEARFLVDGNLIVEGTPKERVVFDGRRNGMAMESWKGIYFSPSSSGSVLSYMLLRNGGGGDLGVLGGAWRRSTIYVDRSSPVLQQIMVLSSGGSGIEFGGSTTRLTNSLIAENQGAGLVVRGPGGQPEILYNTVANNGGDGLTLENASVRFDSNLVSLNEGSGLSGTVPDGAGAELVQHNLFFGNGMEDVPDWLVTDPETGDLVSMNLTADPLLENPNAFNYRLTSNSPAIDAGGMAFAEPYTTELDGNVRLHGAGVDIGAYELDAVGLLYTVDLSSRRAGTETWENEGLTSPSVQRAVAVVPPGQESVYEVRFQNTGNQPETLTLFGGGLAPDWTIQAVLVGDEPIDLTADLFSEAGVTWDEVIPGHEFVIELRMNPGMGEGPFSVWRTLFRGQSSHGDVDEFAWEAAVLSLPQIVSQPIGQTVDEGAPIQLWVEAEGSGFIRYQWKKDGLAVVGQESAEFLIPSATPADAGVYTVDAIGASGSVSSHEVEVVVDAVVPVLPISLALKLTDDSVVLIWEGGIGPFSVLAKESLSDSEWNVLADNLDDRRLIVVPESETLYFTVVSE